jgi:hypothetical protein
MSLARRVPIAGVIAGLALLIIGFNQGNTALIIVGFVLIALGIFRHVKKT